MQSVAHAVIHFYERISHMMRYYWHKDRLSFLIGAPAVFFALSVVVPLALGAVIPFVVTSFAFQILWWPPFLMFLLAERH